MNRSILLRLLPPSRSGPRLAGVAEVVDTGERAPFRDAEDLVRVLRRIHDRPSDSTPTSPPGAPLPE
jgi:hypothetical protein